MRIGKQGTLSSAIATAAADRITVRGYDLGSQLIGKVGLTELFYILLTGVRPTETQRLFIDAALVSVAEHGLVPSVAAARMTLAAAPDAWQGAVAAGLLGCGSVVLGSSETAGHLFSELVSETADTSRPLEEIVRNKLTTMRETRTPLPGFGHPLHRDEDPRATRLLALADTHGVAGAHVGALREIVTQMSTVYGRTLAVNVSGAIPAVLLDVGFPMHAMKGIPLLARTASLVAHLLEEVANPIGFAMAHAGEAAISYSGASAQSTDLT
ncbi:citryl-CoA lyase [Paraburkholderia caribensis]|uniref:citryl-CoA lyase n=1 Tax=Paraburkholderia caribensis TaxID=75105 RepID=UPI0031E1E369